jgi:hypothetical protein
MCAYRQHYGTLGWEAKTTAVQRSEDVGRCDHGVNADEWCEACSIHCRVKGLKYLPIEHTVGSSMKGPL